MICEKCWDDAYWHSLSTGRDQYECYRELLEERQDSPCLPEVRTNTQSATRLPGKCATTGDTKSPATE